METKPSNGVIPPEQRSLWIMDALNHLDQGMTVFNQEMQLVAWNQRWLELLEFPEALAVYGQPLEVLFRFNAERGEYGHGDIDTLVAERLELASHFRPHVFDRIRPDGTVIEIRGNPLSDNSGFVTTYTDVTEQRLAEARLEQRVRQRTEALHNSENWIRQIADAVPALIAYVDKENRYRFINRMHQQWFGLDSEQLIGTSIYDLVEARNLARFKQDVARVLQGQEVQSEYHLRRRDQPAMDVAISFIPHFDDQHQMLGYFFLGQDLTEHKQTQRELLESHKMQALGLLTGGIAHDFNNLLTIILGNLNFLEDDRSDADEVSEAIECCQQAAKRGSNLIQRLLTFSRRQSLKPEVTSLNRLVADFSQLLQRTLGETIQIDCRYQANLARIEIDRNQLETSLLNLALNARDAMPQGGQLLIETSRYQKPAQDNAFSDLPAASYVMLSIRDGGQGMNAETISRAFEPFYTTKPAGMGTGLGLSMVYGFVKQSGGGIDIQSTPQQGTTIRMVFPAVDQTESQQQLDEKRQLDRGNAARVLLVEDDEGVRRFVHRSLRKLGYRVDLVENGELAMEQLRHTSDYDVVLTDIVMPGKISGLDIYSRIHRDYPHTKVLCMTGYSEQLDGDLDESALLRKPFQTRQLASKLEALLHNPYG